MGFERTMEIAYDQAFAAQERDEQRLTAYRQCLRPFAGAEANTLDRGASA